MNLLSRTPAFVEYPDVAYAARIKTAFEDDARLHNLPVPLYEDNDIDLVNVVPAGHGSASSLLGADRIRFERERPEVRLLVINLLAAEIEVRAVKGAGVGGYLLDECSATALFHASATAVGGARGVVSTLAKRPLHPLPVARERHVPSRMSPSMYRCTIALAFDLATATVINHARAVLGRLSATSRVQAVFHATTRGLIEPRTAGAMARCAEQ